MSDKKIPKPEEFQREFEEFVQKRFGKNIHVVAQGLLAPFQAEADKPEQKVGADSGRKKEPDGGLSGFAMKPRELKAYLDRFIIGQDEAKKALSIAVCDHYNQITLHQKEPDLEEHNFYSKQNVLVLGPTGVGKTYMIKQIARLIGVPFIKADATRFSETGYIGANVDDLIRDLVSQAGGDTDLARYGIVYLDEADKLASAQSHGGRDVSGRGVQLGLLKLMEETDIDLKASNDPASQMQIFMEMQQKGRVEKQVVNTRYILFIVSGAFTGLEHIIGRRLRTSAIGFDAKGEQLPDRHELLSQADTEDFIRYGFEPEFVGRLPVRVTCHQLDDKSLFDILKNSEGSIIRQYCQAFRSYGIKLKFNDNALRSIARLAAREKTGARSLMTTCEKIFRDFKFELPSAGIREVEVTQDLVDDPRTFLSNLLKEAAGLAPADRTAIQGVEDKFLEDHGIRITFDPKARQLLCQGAKDKGLKLCEFCQKLLASYEHGLKLIGQNTGAKEFVLDSNVVSSPEQALERMVKESCTRPGSF